MSETDNSLKSINEHGDKVAIIPLEVRGFWRRHRNWTQIVLLLIFMSLPWITINGEQSLLLDFINRKFAIFGLVFWAHDAPLIFLVLLTATMGLAFVTSIWGRVWCGWACPQTVFIDAVYRRIETFVEGPALTRKKNLTQPLTFALLFKKIFKWVLFIIVSSLIAHSFAAYFVGSKTLLHMMSLAPQDNWGYFTTITAITCLLLFDFGYFREQFCIVACPYGRIQSLLMDNNSLAVIYDEKRGEPRRGTGAGTGDCVNCNRCVAVCPTACDIRKGVQLECITCTACIDACDEIMEKVNKPKGLISYNSISGKKGSLKSPRSLVYLTVIGAAVLILTLQVMNRKDLNIAILRGKESPYQILKNENNEEILINHYRLHIKNQTREDRGVEILVTDPTQKDQVEIVNPMGQTKLNPWEDKTLHFFVKVKKDFMQGQSSKKVNIRINQEEQTLEILGPQ